MQMKPIIGILPLFDEKKRELLDAPNKKFVWGVQWHPEFMYTEKESQKIFEEFIRKCRE